MTTDTAARQPKGIPSGGQFAATAHAEPDVALATPPAEAAGLKLIADFHDELSPEHKAALDHWHDRLQGAGVAGELEILSIDGADTDAGGPTVTGTWRSPEGADFGFAVDHKNVELSRGIDWNLDANHLGDDSWTRKLGDSTISDEDLTNTFTALRDRTRISKGWASGTAMRSNDKFQFAIPERVSEGPGQEAAQVEIISGNGDEYVVRIDQGGSDVRVYGPHQGLLSDRMAEAFLTDVSEACGGSAGQDDVKNALKTSMTAGTGEGW